ncbi:CAP domain-containing protein [Streptomyces sp. NPDC050355]|uniref:CAP domain-containing protein n=1 Tax=Streptomyces sp. NPDC050355 TaxID=3365609 RepID=UPI00379777F4
MNNDDELQWVVLRDGTSTGTETGTGSPAGEPASHRRSTPPGPAGRHARTAPRGGTHRAVSGGPSTQRKAVLLAVAAAVAAGGCSLALIRPGSGPDQELAADRSPAAQPTEAASVLSAPNSASPTPPRHKASASPSDAERHGKRHAPQRPRKTHPESSSKTTTADTPSRTSRTEAGARAKAPTAPRAATGTAARFAQKVVDLVNDQRAQHGCGPLTVDPRVQKAAQAHSDDMAARNYYEHNTPEGVDPGTRMTNAGFRWSSWAENIFKSPKDPATALKGWMESPGHRANILNCSYKYTGVGVNLRSNGPWWTQDFATGS